MSYQISLSTSSRQGSLCIAKDFASIYSLSWNKHNAHAELVTPFVAQALQTLKIDIQDIDHFICDIGPGSFTGVRVATSTIKSLAYNQGSNSVVAITANQLLAQGLHIHNKPICTIINAQRNEFYVAFYTPDKITISEKSSPRLMSIEEISKKISKPHLVIGDGADLFIQNTNLAVQKKSLRQLPLANDYPNASNSLLFAKLNIEAYKTLDWKCLEPLYIRASSAEEKLINGGLEIARNYVRRKNK